MSVIKFKDSAWSFASVAIIVSGFVGLKHVWDSVSINGHPAPKELYEEAESGPLTCKLTSKDGNVTAYISAPSNNGSKPIDVSSQLLWNEKSEAFVGRDVFNHARDRKESDKVTIANVPGSTLCHYLRGNVMTNAPIRDQTMILKPSERTLTLN